MKKASYLFMSCLFMITFFGGCRMQQKMYTKQFFGAFDTVTVISGYAKTESEFAENAESIFDKLSEYHKSFDIYNNYDDINNIKTINDNAGAGSVRVSEEIIDMLQFSIDMHEITNGKMNIAMGSVLKIWHEYRENGINSPENASLPSYEMLADAAKHTDINNIEIDKTAGTVYIADENMSLDVGAVAKGYAVERVCEYAESVGMTNMYVSVGGNVRTLGTKADGTAWRIGIMSPYGDNNDIINTVSVSDMSVITSGAYQRYYTVNGKNYNHIIDPDTLMPSELYLSVTVVCEDSAVGDALSTALFNMDIEDGLKLIESMDNVEAYWILSGGREVRSTGFGAIEGVK